MMLRRALPAVLILVAAGGWLAMPARWQVDGLSMAPGLMPGDIASSGWFPTLDQWRAPRRFERWTLVEPGQTVAVKRVWGLPGEEIAIVDGDLVVDGAVVLKPPAVLAELALPVASATSQDSATGVRVAIEDPVLDDVPFAPNERRLLVPVRDVGITAIVHATAVAEPSLPCLVDVRVGDRMARVHLPAIGRFAVVAGRLDGCFVAGAWPLSDQAAGAGTGVAVPRGAPAAWSLASPWTGSEVVLACEVAVVTGSNVADVRVESVATWRDIHALPPAAGTTQWRLGRAEYFLLGDFPGGSRDSRHWGSLDVAQLRHRIASFPTH